MSERYKKLYHLKRRLYAPESPVIIESGALLLEQSSNALLCQLCFRNIQERPIKALRAVVQLRDERGRALGKPVDHRYLDLELQREEEYGRDTAIVLPPERAASFTVRLSQVSFADGEVWTDQDVFWEELPEQQSLEDFCGGAEAAERYRRRHGESCRFAPLETEELWFCACGAVNRSGDGRCHRCRLRHSALFGRGGEPRDQEGEETRFTPVKAEPPSPKGRRRWLIWAGAGLCVLALGAALLLPRLKAAPPAAEEMAETATASPVLATEAPVDERQAAYEAALALQEKADYAPLEDASRLYGEAAEAFEALGDYADAAALAQACREKEVAEGISLTEIDYDAAAALLEEGRYSEARAAFLALDDFRDSREQADEALYRRNHALYTYLKEHELRGVTASLSAEPEQESRIALSRAQLLRLGSQGLQELEAVFGGDPLLLITEDSAAGTLRPIEQELAEQFEALGDYRDSAALAAELPEMIDRSGEFFALCAAGELESARDWLNAYDKPFEDRELWLSLIGRYLPYCQSWKLFSGDPSLPSQAVGGAEKLYTFRCEVLLTPEGAVLRFVSEDAAGDAPEMSADLQDGRFMTQLGSTGFIAQLNTSGSLTMVKLRDGATVGGAEYVPQR